MRDRRRRPTPMLSRYWLFGRRRAASDGYVDRYTAGEWALVGMVVVLSLLDLLLTIDYLEMGGEEANPLMRAVLSRGYLWFAIVKMGVTLLGTAFVLMHIRFGRVRWLMLGLVACNLALLAYHVYLRVALA